MREYSAAKIVDCHSLFNCQTAGGGDFTGRISHQVNSQHTACDLLTNNLAKPCATLILGDKPAGIGHRKL